MDIINLEREKAITRCLMNAIPLRIAGLDSTSCYQYLINHPNREVVDLINTIHKAADYIDNEWQRDMIKSIMNVGLTICCRYDKYTAILSKVLTNMYGYDVQIEKYKSFNVLEKAMLKILLKTSDKILKQRDYSLHMAHDLLGDCGNDAVQFIYSAISVAMKDELTDVEYSKNIPMVDFFIYVLYQDTAYRDVFFWLLNEISRKEICDVINKFVKKPHDWYVNIWFRSKKLSEKQRNSGVIPRYEQSVVERRMVPAKQTYELNKLAERK